MINPEKIKTTISESYKSLGYSPRGFQTDIIFTIVDSFLNKGMKNVICSLDTGAGKSIIGAVVADVIDVLTPEDNRHSSVISMGINVLAKQYYDTFSTQSKYRYFQVKGASNYSCEFLKSQPSATSYTADECLKSRLHEVEEDRYCKNCEFNEAKELARSTSNLITNTSYFLTANLLSHHLPQYKTHVFDESHNMNESFCAFAEITVSIDLLTKYIKELSDTNGKCEDQIYKLTNAKNSLNTKNVNLSNYKEFLIELKDTYAEISKIISVQATMLKVVDVVKSGKYDKIASKYTGLGVKISELFKNEYDHVFDDSVPNSISVKTIFVGKMMEKLLSSYNLFMSATITKNFAFDTLELNKEETEFIDTAPVFPPENKQLFFIGKRSLNYQVMKDPDTINELKAQTKLITKFHENDSGLIIVPSFYLGSQLAYGIKTHKVFEHKSGINLSDLIYDFKRYNKPAILVSPSIFEGLSFDDDHSRFQIIAKTPYPSLGDKRIKYIADNYPDIYREMSLIKIVQGIGRSVRSEEDFAATYFLDMSSKKLFDSGLNIWKNRFTVQT